MLEKEIKELDSKLRYKAKQNGLLLRKSRVSLSIDNKGGYMIVDFNNCVVAGEKFDLTLDDVAEFIKEIV